VSGVGKSTIVDAFYFALSGKTFRPDLKINEMVNWTTETNCRVILSFENSKNDVFKITRTLKDETEDIFDITKNGELVPIDKKKKDYQHQLYEILGIDEHYIKIGLIKSNLHDVSFLSMSKKDRIEFGEKFFKLDIISKVELSVKEDQDSVKIKLNQIEQDYTKTTQFKTTLETKIYQMKKLLEESFTNQLEEKSKRILEITAEIEKNNKAVEIINKIVLANKELETKYHELVKEQNKFLNEKVDLESVLKMTKNKKKLFLETCPSCDKPNTVLFSNVNITDIEKKISEFENKRQNLIQPVSELNQKINKNKESINKQAVVNSNLRRLNTEMIQTKGDIEKLSEKKPDIDYTELNQLSEKLVELNSEKDLVAHDLKVLTELRKLMIPLKIFILKRRLTELNISINNYLRRFGLSRFVLIFDANFNPKIYLNKKVLNYGSLSMGQARRFDLAMLFTFIDLASQLNHAEFNVLMCDEILSNLDEECIQMAIEVLREKSIQKNMEVIFISHGISTNQKVDREIKVSADDGFGKIIEEI